MNKELKSSQIRFLRGRAHKLKPVVYIGNAGVHENLVREIDLSLDHHELIKVKVSVGGHDERDRVISEICAQVKATLVQRVGHVATLFRQSKKKKIALPA